MNFMQLHSLINEVPHFEIPDIYNLDGVSWIDYHVEDWTVDFELKQSLVKILRELNDQKLLIKVKEGRVMIVQDGQEYELLNHSVLRKLLDANDINAVLFNNVLVTNQDKIEYI